MGTRYYAQQIFAKEVTMDDAAVSESCPTLSHQISLMRGVHSFNISDGRFVDTNHLPSFLYYCMVLKGIIVG